MKKSLLFLSLIILSVSSQSKIVFAQNLDSTYSTIAKYCILNYALDKYADDSETNLLWLSSAIRDLESIVELNRYEYEIIEVFKFKSFKFLNVVDLGIVDPHRFNQTIVAIDTLAEQYEKSVYFINSQRPEDFINRIIYNDKTFLDREKIVSLYAQLREVDDIDITFFRDETNKEEFKYLEYNYNIFDDLLRYDRSESEIYTIYKRDIGDRIDFYYVSFVFKPYFLSVEETLLFRVSKRNK